MNNKNLNLGTPLLQGGSHAVMPSLGHGTGLLYRERETPARAPINLSPYNPEYSWGLGENRGVHGKLALRLLRHKTTNTGAHKINMELL